MINVILENVTGLANNEKVDQNINILKLDNIGCARDEMQIFHKREECTGHTKLSQHELVIHK